MIACKRGNLDVIKYLLENGENIDATDEVSLIIYIFNRPLASKVPRRIILSLLV
jgi:ankyrin repeat protein